MDKVTLVLHDIPVNRLLELIACLYYDGEQDLPACFQDQDVEFWKNVCTACICEKPNQDWKDTVLQLVKSSHRDIVKRRWGRVLATAAKKQWSKLIQYCSAQGVITQHVLDECLLRESQYGRLSSVTSLLACGANPASTKTAIPAFISAVNCDQLAIVTAMIQHDKNIIHTTYMGKNAVRIRACLRTEDVSKDLSVIRFLLQSGVHLLGDLMCASPMLDDVIRSGAHLDVVKELVVALKAMDKKASVYEMSNALTTCAKEGYAEAAELLLEHGASIQDPFGDVNALHRAIFCCQPDVFTVLLRYCSKDTMDAEDSRLHSALQLIILHSGPDTCRSNKDVWRRRQNAYEKMAKDLVDAGADVPGSLIFGIHKSMPKLFYYIVSKKKLDIKNLSLDDSVTLLHQAVQYPSASATQIRDIITHQPDLVKARDKHGDMPLHKLAAYVTADTVRPDEQDIVEELIKAGARLDARNRKGELPFQLCNLGWVSGLLMPEDVKQGLTKICDESLPITVVRRPSSIRNLYALPGMMTD